MADPTEAIESDIRRLRDEHNSIGLGDPLSALKEVADRHGIDIDTAIKIWILGGGQNQIAPSIH